MLREVAQIHRLQLLQLHGLFLVQLVSQCSRWEIDELLLVGLRQQTMVVAQLLTTKC
jgi:hypothetical protein